MTTDMNKLKKSIDVWSERRGLDQSDPLKQFGKVLEEVQETYVAQVNNDRAGIIDGIGDIYVTIQILAQQNGVDIAECVASSYDEIKDREGEMVNGVFVKNE